MKKNNEKNNVTAECWNSGCFYDRVWGKEGHDGSDPEHLLAGSK